MQGATISVSERSRFEAELDLDEAIAAHPEVLPSKDLGLGPLIALGRIARFAEIVNHHEQALQWRSYERNPLDWAYTHVGRAARVSMSWGVDTQLNW